MPISKEAMDWLHELEKNENWTSIPDDDMRIVKLRVLFEVDKKEYFGRTLKATKGSKEWLFNGVRHCADKLGIETWNIKNALQRKNEHKGYRFEYVEEDE